MPFVKAPAIVNRDIHRTHGVKRQPKRTNRTREHRGVSQIEAVALVFKQFARLARLLAPGLGQIDIGPAGKTVFEIPLAFAVTH